MVRISDARMSGTSYGTCVLHVSPESYIGGPLALVQGRRPDLARRGEPATGSAGIGRRTGARAAPQWMKPAPTLRPRIHGAYMPSASRRRIEGCDFDFLDQKMEMPEPEIH